MQKITDTIYLVPGRNKGRFPYCHCLYIKDDVCALIDTACGEESLQPLLGRADMIINSHFHPDHVRGNGSFPQAHIRCHEDDRDGLLTFAGMLRYKGYDHFSKEQVARIMELVDFRPSRVDSTFRGGDILDFGRTKLQVIHTPGHTPGHCCFYEEKTGLMFGADIDLTVFGPWYGHECSQLEPFEQSMQALMDNPPAIFVSGHEAGVLRGDIRGHLTRYALHFAQREKLILETLRRPHTLEALAELQLIYPRHPEPTFLFYYFEFQMLQKHLKKMLKQGKIKENFGIYSRL
jgi:glyoxylase-like metal-dependent hydrolase (beta-lactamase superfamily II)